jgi:hypothetical protein
MGRAEGLVAGGAGWDVVMDYMEEYLQSEFDERATADGSSESAVEDFKVHAPSEKQRRQVVAEAVPAAPRNRAERSGVAT